MKNKIWIVGMGPGNEEMMTGRAIEVLEQVDVIIGYTVYLDLLGERFQDKEFLSTPMRQEEKRCRMCFEEAGKGKSVAMVCSGDAGVYGMASLMYEIGKEYPEVELSHEYIDSAALKLIRRPWEYDVILTANLFGDIISDEGTGLTGTAGLFGSAELSVSGKGLYTPNQLHYPDESVIGKQKVSPVGMIMAAALMLRCSFGLEKEAKTVENAIEKVLEAKISTEDMKYPGAKIVLTGEMADFCCQFLGKDV